MDAIRRFGRGRARFQDGGCAASAGAEVTAGGHARRVDPGHWSKIGSQLPAACPAPGRSLAGAAHD
jgi:hypothetical protein